MKKKAWDGWTNKEVKYLKHLRLDKRLTTKAIMDILGRTFGSVNGKLRAEKVYLPGRARRHRVIYVHKDIISEQRSDIQGGVQKVSTPLQRPLNQFGRTND